MQFSLRRLFFVIFLASLFAYIIAGFSFWAHPNRRLELIPAPVEK